ncbi:hypothetical protein L0244_02120, partial [bacterium]|nr:hypothetical protein [bacterium]
MIHLTFSIATAFIFVIWTPSLHAAQDAVFDTGVLRWRQNQQADSVKWFLAERSYVYYDQMRVLLNRMNAYHLKGLQGEAQELRSAIAWLNESSQKSNAAKFLQRMNVRYHLWSLAERQAKAVADSLIVAADKFYDSN